MNKVISTSMMLLSLAVGSIFPLSAMAAEDSPVVELVTVDTQGNTKAYLNNVKGVLARMKTLAPKMNNRVYRSLYGGTETGIIYVVNEFPSLTYLAEAVKKFENDEEYINGLKILGKTERKLISESILVDVTP